MHSWDTRSSSLLVDPDGGRLHSNLWAQYGVAGVLEHEGFVRGVATAADAAGVGIEQFHPEYGENQFEISLSPLAPVAAADQLVLTRIIISRVARDFGMRVSFSPLPFAGGVGSGAHQHFSLIRGDAPLFSGGSGAHRMTVDGEAAIAGIVDGLIEAQLALCGSIVSGLRMKPGSWAGAFACWGVENREAAVRFLHVGPGNPYGANVEVKVVDPSANPTWPPPPFWVWPWTVSRARRHCRPKSPWIRRRCRSTSGKPPECSNFQAISPRRSQHSRRRNE